MSNSRVRTKLNIDDQRRRALRETARISGESGAERLPDEIHIADPSDSMLIECVDIQRMAREQNRARLAPVPASSSDAPVVPSGEMQEPAASADPAETSK